MFGFKKKTQQANEGFLRLQQVAMLRAQEEGKRLHKNPLETAIEIAEACDFEHRQHWREFIDVADLLLAEYPTYFSVSVAHQYTNPLISNPLGYIPFGKIMIATQYVDRMAGQPVLARYSFMKEHQKLLAYLTQSNLPERTKKAVSFLSTATFYFPNLDAACSRFNAVFVVSEMAEGVKDYISNLDATVGNYLIKTTG
jgi:hypothetical protein